MSGKRYIFYDNLSGDVIVEESRNRIEIMPTVDRVIEMYPKLSERNSSTYGIIVLDYNDYLQDFREADDYRVNPETKELEFSYPDPNEPEVEQPFRVPLSEEVEVLKTTNEDLSNYVLEMDMRLVMIEMGM